MSDPHAMNLDAYYRGLGAERVQALGDELVGLSQQAEQAEAHQAALHLADVATQLLEIGVALSGEAADPGH